MRQNPHPETDDNYLMQSCFIQLEFRTILPHFRVLHQLNLYCHTKYTCFSHFRTKMALLKDCASISKPVWLFIFVKRVFSVDTHFYDQGLMIT